MENAKHFYLREMDEHFVESKFIITKELQNLHEKHKSLAEDKLRKEMPEKHVIPMISQQLYQKIEVIFEQYNRQT